MRFLTTYLRRSDTTKPSLKSLAYHYLYDAEHRPALYSRSRLNKAIARMMCDAEVSYLHEHMENTDRIAWERVRRIVSWPMYRLAFAKQVQKLIQQETVHYQVELNERRWDDDDIRTSIRQAIFMLGLAKGIIDVIVDQRGRESSALQVNWADRFIEWKDRWPDCMREHQPTPAGTLGVYPSGVTAGSLQMASNVSPWQLTAARINSPTSSKDKGATYFGSKVRAELHPRNSASSVACAGASSRPDPIPPVLVASNTAQRADSPNARTLINPNTIPTVVQAGVSGATVSVALHKVADDETCDRTLLKGLWKSATSCTGSPRRWFKRTRAAARDLREHRSMMKARTENGHFSVHSSFRSKKSYATGASRPPTSNSVRSGSLTPPDACDLLDEDAKGAVRWANGWPIGPAFHNGQPAAAMH